MKKHFLGTTCIAMFVTRSNLRPHNSMLPVSKFIYPLFHHMHSTTCFTESVKYFYVSFLSHLYRCRLDMFTIKIYLINAEKVWGGDLLIAALVLTVSVQVAYVFFITNTFLSYRSKCIKKSIKNVWYSQQSRCLGTLWGPT